MPNTRRRRQLKERKLPTCKRNENNRYLSIPPPAHTQIGVCLHINWRKNVRTRKAKRKFTLNVVIFQFRNEEQKEGSPIDINQLFRLSASQCGGHAINLVVFHQIWHHWLRLKKALNNRFWALGEKYKIFEIEMFSMSVKSMLKDLLMFFFKS